MKIRIKIDLLLRNRELSQVRLIEDIDKKITAKVETNNEKYKKNIFYNLVENKKIFLSQRDCDNIEVELYNQLANIITITPYKLHLLKKIKKI